MTDELEVQGSFLVKSLPLSVFIFGTRLVPCVLFEQRHVP